MITDFFKNIFKRDKTKSTDLTSLVESYFSSTASIDNLKNPTFYQGLNYIVNVARTFTWKIKKGDELEDFVFNDYFQPHDDFLQNFIFSLYTNGIAGVAINRKNDSLETAYRNITYVYGLDNAERFIDAWYYSNILLDTKSVLNKDFFFQHSYGTSGILNPAFQSLINASIAGDNATRSYILNSAQTASMNAPIISYEGELPSQEIFEQNTIALQERQRLLALGKPKILHLAGNLKMSSPDLSSIDSTTSNASAISKGEILSLFGLSEALISNNTTKGRFQLFVTSTIIPLLKRISLTLTR